LAVTLRGSSRIETLGKYIFADTQRHEEASTGEEAVDEKAKVQSSKGTLIV
jgi:hypothetical protein